MNCCLLNGMTIKGFWEIYIVANERAIIHRTLENSSVFYIFRIKISIA